ncbi:MAG TPA: hypothetical protein VHO70_23860 [Chitinispirillaceae bacterium]|nr:hypothetical protein [Chitinispirillaceae bacterium]
MVDFPKTLFDANELMTISTRFCEAARTVVQDSTIQIIVEYVTVDEDSLRSALSKGLTSKLTAIVSQAESTCDNSYTTFRSLTKTMAEQNDNLAIASKATIVLTILRNVNWDLHLLGYKKQLVQLEALDKKLATPEAVEAMESTGLKMWYDTLVAATVKLKNAVDARNAELIENDYPLVKESSVALYGHLIKLYNYVDIHEETNPDVFVPVARKFDTALNAVIPIARQRKAKKPAVTETILPVQPTVTAS